MSFEKMTLHRRVEAVNIDCMRNKDFALLSGIICMGKSDVKDGIPTAGTDGKNKYYGAEFIKDMTRKQLRYLVLHENFHVALKHCIAYRPLEDRFGGPLCNIAMDYVVNGLIEELDPALNFVERPTEVPPLVDAKYKGMSFPQVLKSLVDDMKANGQDPEQMKKDMDAMKKALEEMLGKCLDEHMHGDAEDGGEELTEQEIAKLGKDIDDANHQGALLAQKLRGDGKGGRDIFELAAERATNWQDALRDFLSSVCQGDEQSRFCPPNKRLLASGFIMPSHFTETIGEIVIACDTSGSMHPYYSLIFGEIARICGSVRPEGVRVLWWDTSVCGDQEFKPDQYDQIATLMSPKGGGGTVVSCVAQYIAKKKLTPKCVIYLTDGYIESDYEVPKLPVLFGVVDNDDFVPHTGKVVRIKP
jgi:predicted metal-dependent peptidase